MVPEINIDKVNSKDEQSNEEIASLLAKTYNFPKKQRLLLETKTG
jgi:hypothetical protein